MESNHILMKYIYTIFFVDIFFEWDLYNLKKKKNYQNQMIIHYSFKFALSIDGFVNNI